MRIKLDLPDDLMTEVKIPAAQENRKPKEEIAHLLRRGLVLRPGDAGPVRHRVQLPLVECAHEAPPGEKMTTERVADVLVEDESENHGGPLR